MNRLYTLTLLLFGFVTIVHAAEQRVRVEQATINDRPFERSERAGLVRYARKIDGTTLECISVPIIGREPYVYCELKTDERVTQMSPEEAKESFIVLDRAWKQRNRNSRN